MASLEASLGLALFRREMPGLKPTAQGEVLLRSARVIEDAMLGFARQAHGANTQLRGPITATMSLSMAVGLAPSLAAFARQWPEVILTVKTTTDRADLKAMEADVAIRALSVGTHPDPSLVGRGTAVLNEAAYGSEGVEGGIASSDDPNWAAGTPFPDLPVRFVMPEVALRFEACRLGMGMAMLPCFLGDRHIPRRSEPAPLYKFWVLVHPDLRRNPRLKAFREAMVESITVHADQLRG